MRTLLHAMGASALGAAMVLTASAAPVSAGDFSYVARGTVVKTTDGDTFFGKVAAEDFPVSRIRLSGIQAMETGECHAKESTRMLAKLLPRRTPVTVKARFKSSHVPNPKERNQPRPLRYAFNNRGVDVQLAMLRSGLVLPNLMGRETLLHDEYWEAAQMAAQEGKGLFDTDFCGIGPAQSAQFRVMVNYNADGNDAQNKNGKYVRILNTGTVPVALGGWELRTAKHAEIYFPRGTQLPVGGEVLVFQGKGQDSGNRFYWGNRNRESFPNPKASRYGAAGAYLVDPQGDYRAWTMYPCRVSCVNPYAGKLRMTVIYDPEGNENANPNSEMAVITNVSKETLDLSYTVIEVGNAEVLEFPRGTQMQPGESVEVHVGLGKATRLDHYLGRNESILPNGGSGAKAVLRTHESVRIACFAWGAERC